MFRKPSIDRNHGGVGDSEDGFAEDGVALELLAWAGVYAVVGVELFPVDRVALGKPDAIVDAESGAHVAGGIAAGVGRDIVVAGEGRMEDGDGLTVGRGLASGQGEVLEGGRRGGDEGGDSMSEVVRNCGSGGQGDVQEEERLRTFRECASRVAESGGLQACRDGRGVEGLDDFIVGENFEFLDSDVTAGEVQHPELVDEMRLAVGAGEGYRRVLHGQDERRGILCRTGCGWGEGESECGAHYGPAK